MRRPRRAPGRGGLAVAGLRLLLVGGALAVLQGTAPAAAAAQVGWRDLVITGGFSAERYRGNLAAVSVEVPDSTERAAAAVGEFGARGLLWLVDRPGRRLSFDFDGGLRQFAATGFELRDYAPREWAGRAGLTWVETGSAGAFQARASFRGRSVEDRPPMPLFLQPGYGNGAAALLYRTLPVQGVRFEMQVDGELTDYRTLELAPRLALLDRRAAGLEVGALLAEDEAWTIRFFGAYRRSEYRNQGTFDPGDPFRRDRTIHAGARWTLASTLGAEVGVEGTMNRSNSRRPEYDALTLRGVLSAPLPQDFSVNVLGVLTGKTYVHKASGGPDFARLVPGEEANSASVLYVDLNRPLSLNLDAAFRLGWTRAETDLADAYFQRFGASFFLNFRPVGL